MQYLLSNITPSINYHGRYIVGRNNSRYKNNLMFSKQKLSGYWNRDAEAWKDAGVIFSSTTGQLESLFLSDEGTTTEYVESTEGGWVLPITDKEKPEGWSAELINTAHDSALRFLDDTCYRPDDLSEINPNVFFTPMMNFLASDNDEAKAFYGGLLRGNKSMLHRIERLRRAVREKKFRSKFKLLLKCQVRKIYDAFPSVVRMVTFPERMAGKIKMLYIYHTSAKHIDRAYDIAEDCSIISFDVFDTLIFRKCSTLEVFDAAEEIYNSTHETKTECFKERRIEAQRSAYKKSLTQELTLDAIYSELADKYGQDFAEDMKSAEIQAEFDAVYPNEEVLRFCHDVRAAGKRIIIASDMYLPGGVITGLLKKCGCEDFDSVYVSSDYGMRKSSGSLFRRIVSVEGTAPSEIMHIGDNMHSDYVMAKRYELKGFLYKK